MIYYNEKLLNECIQKDNAIFIEAYKDKLLNKLDDILYLTRNCYIKYNCKCTNIYTNNFRNAYRSGFICKECFTKNKKEKVKNTNLERYGVENTFQSKEKKEKIKQTNNIKYGIDYPTQNKEILNKIKKVNLEKYGVENQFQSEEVKGKIRKTNLDKYGVENAIQNKDIKDKLRSTFLKKYGVEHALQNKKCKDKMIQTNLKRYGVEHSQQNQEIQEKTQRNAKKYKPYKMPSGALRKVQGYEPFALNELIKSYTEEQIKTDRKDVPRIEYILDNKKHYYFPDIYISHENYIIEIKSIWTYKKELDKNDKKAEACKKEGYKFEFWVYDCKGNKQII